MAVHKLILDDVFDDSVFTLIAIHCTIEDYRLAYFLNKYLKINLIRKKSDLDFNQGTATYSIYKWEDKKQLLTWNLVSNIYKKNDFSGVNAGQLFDTTQSITKTFYLLPEFKAVNYLLKVDDEFNIKQKKCIINTILSIPQIAISYIINHNQLKSKDNLIFN